MASYDEEFKKRLVRMHLEEGRTIKSLSEEYQVSENGIGYWLKKYREECSKNPAAQEEYDLMKENLRLRKELEEAKNINIFAQANEAESLLFLLTAYFSPPVSFVVLILPQFRSRRKFQFVHEILPKGYIRKNKKTAVYTQRSSCFLMRYMKRRSSLYLHSMRIS